MLHALLGVKTHCPGHVWPPALMKWGWARGQDRESTRAVLEAGADPLARDAWGRLAGVAPASRAHREKLVAEGWAFPVVSDGVCHLDSKKSGSEYP